MQALLLMNVQSSEMTIRELVERGYHVGSNVTYNVRQLVDAGYVEQHRSERDRRSVKLKLTQRGLDLCARLSDLESRHAESLLKLEGGDGSEQGRDMLRSLERVWSDYIQYGSS